MPDSRLCQRKEELVAVVVIAHLADQLDRATRRRGGRRDAGHHPVEAATERRRTHQWMSDHDDHPASVPVAEPVRPLAGPPDTAATINPVVRPRTEPPLTTLSLQGWY
jgi:hypothetical protein